MSDLSEKKLLRLKLTSFAIITGCIVGVLSLYYLKFLPEKQNEYHHSAFRELAQIQQALTVRNEGYIQAISNYAKDGKQINLESLTDFFANNGFTGMGKGSSSKDSYKVDQPILTQDELTRKWQLTYMVHSITKKDCSKIVGLSKNLDSILDQLISNYKDIFNDFILIRGKLVDNSGLSLYDSCRLNINLKTDDQKDAKNNGKLNQDIIIYNSANLPLDYQVKTDSLFKNKGGFSLLNVQNVTIEGNPYKLFLYPFQLGKERIILSGLISLSNYSAAYKEIPLGYTTFMAVLVLLFIIYLPIVKIFKLGKLERTTAMDIRLLIATYFIGAFVLFFLLFKLFLDKNQTHKNKTNLEILSEKVNDNFRSEILAMCRQLKSFDQSVPNFRHYKNEDNPLNGLVSYEADTCKERHLHDSELDDVFNPVLYPYLDQLFWIDSLGIAKATRAYKKNYGKTPLVDVRGREYFTDFVQKRFLTIDDTFSKATDTFTIQPTLDKLDGEYIINVIMRSDPQNNDVWQYVFHQKCMVPGPYMPVKLIGLSSKMHSVCNPVLPPGYNFSIVNGDGQILYDSKSGRALLSNFLNGIENPSKLYQSIKYRSSIFLDHLTLRGREVSLLSSPIKDFPYTLLIYYKNADSDSYEEHLISLTAFCTFFSLILVLGSSIMNQCFKKRRSLLQAPSLNFDWLYPLQKKKYYYQHLIRFMLMSFFLYILAWVVAAFCYPKMEFIMFFITLIFPFSIALLYFLIRKKYSDEELKELGTTSNNFQFKALLSYLLMMIATLNFLYLFSQPDFHKNFLLLLFFQIISGGLNYWSYHSFTKKSSGNDEASFLRQYVWAILIGVFMISIIPAVGIFCLIYRQEHSLELNNEQLYLARCIQLRGLEINKRAAKYKYGGRQAFNSGQLDFLKFQLGIYSLNGISVVYRTPDKNDLDTLSIAPAYTRLHSLFFPEDSVTLTGQRSQYTASDGSWYFRQTEKDDQNEPRLLYKNLQDGYTSHFIKLNLDDMANYNSVHLLEADIACLTPSPGLFLAFALSVFVLISIGCYYLSRSLAERLFLRDLWLIYSTKKNPNNITLDKNYFFRQITERYANDKALQSILILPSPLDLNAVYKYETEALIKYNDEKVFYMKDLMKIFYEQIWNGLDKTQKFILYDFAEDGFTNYKADYILLRLLNQGIIKFDDQRLCLMTPSFREYILQMSDDKDVVQNMERAKKQDYWKMIKTPLLLLLTGIGIFIFISQQETYQKITGILTTLCTVIPLISSLFNLKNGNGTEKKKEKHKGKDDKKSSDQ